MRNGDRLRTFLDNLSVGYLGKFPNTASAENYANTTGGGLSGGMWYYNTTADAYFYWNGSIWVSGEINVVEYPIFDWLLLNGAAADTLNGGNISTTNLPVASQVPAIQFKVDLYELVNDVNLLIAVMGGHSTINQTLDLDLDHAVVNPGENYNTKAGGATVNSAPVSPAVAYERFAGDIIYSIPHADLEAGGSLECRLTRNVGAETGDFHIWQIRAYQVL